MDRQKKTPTGWKGHSSTDKLSIVKYNLATACLPIYLALILSLTYLAAGIMAITSLALALYSITGWC